MVHKIFMAVILIVLLPTLLYSQELKLYNVLGWSYSDGWGIADLEKTGMRPEAGLKLDSKDSVIRINSLGWTTKIGDEWNQMNSFVKKELRENYPWPNYVLIDINIIDTINTRYLGLVIVMLDTTESGKVGYIYAKIPIVFGWQTIKLTWSLPVKGYVSSIGLAFTSFSIDSGYTGAEYQVNDFRLGYNNGNITLIDPFQVIWPSTVGISDEKQTPSEFVLSQNYPNPFNPSTQITYSLPTSGGVKLSVYNLLGQEVATLVDGDQSIGQHSITFDASHLASGTYLYVLSVDNKIIDRKKMLLLK